MGIDECRVLGWAAVDVDYWPIGAELTYEGRVILLQNWTDADLWFSDDPDIATGKFPLKAGDKIILDCSSNQTFGRGLFLPVGATLYVKQLDVPTKGNIYLTIFYGKE
jgi:hypothetical protein